jgi:hypothetical protein
MEFLFKVILTFMRVFYGEASISSIYLTILHIFWGIVLIRYFFQQYPYYNKFVSKYFGISVAVYLWFSSTLAICEISQIGPLTNNMWVVLTVGLAFWLKFFLTMRSSTYVKLLAKEIEDIEDETLLDI